MNYTVSNKAKGTERRAGERYDGDLRRALMDAAILAHSEFGFEKLSLRAVARSINVSHAAPAHYFGDKAGLLTAIAAEGFELLAARLAKVADPNGKPLRVLHAMAQAYAEFAVSFPAHYDAMFRRELHRLDNQFYRAGGTAYDALKSMITTFQDRGWRSEADTTALTTALWALIHGITMLRSGGAIERHHPGAMPEDIVLIAMSLFES